MLGERGRCGPQDVWVTRTRHSPHRSGEPSICRALVHQSLSHRICSHSGLQLRGGKKKNSQSENRPSTWESQRSLGCWVGSLGVGREEQGCSARPNTWERQQGKGLAKSTMKTRWGPVGGNSSWRTQGPYQGPGSPLRTVHTLAAFIRAGKAFIMTLILQRGKPQ